MKSNFTRAQLIPFFGAALFALIAIDLGIQRISPVSAVREVEDGLAELEAGDPRTVVLGSSHARTFHVLGARLAQRNPKQPSLVAIPLEGGKLTGYRWIMERRLLPLLDERAPNGTLKRGNVRRLILLTEWWDSCSTVGTDPRWNIAARAWRFSDYVQDVRARGFTDLNRNYLRERVRQALRHSVLVQRRGSNQIIADVGKIAGNRVSVHTSASYARAVAQWRRMIESGKDCIGDETQISALRAILEESNARGIKVFVLLFPRKPDTITARGRELTLVPFRQLVADVISPYDAQLIDLTEASPLTSRDFMDDFDHVSAGGNMVFSDWALDGPLRFLLEPSRQPDLMRNSNR